MTVTVIQEKEMNRAASGVSVAELDRKLEQAIQENERSEKLICEYLFEMNQREGHKEFGYSDIWDYSALSLSVRALDRKIREDKDNIGTKVRIWLSDDQAAVWNQAVEVCLPRDSGLLPGGRFASPIGSATLRPDVPSSSRARRLPVQLSRLLDEIESSRSSHRVSKQDGS